MAYEQKPGDFAIFKNDRKQKDTHPDYTGNGLSLDGKDVQIACWLKEGRNGKFFSCVMKLKESGQEKPQEKPKAQGGLDDDIPFAQFERGTVA